MEPEAIHSVINLVLLFPSSDLQNKRKKLKAAALGCLLRRLGRSNRTARAFPALCSARASAVEFPNDLGLSESNSLNAKATLRRTVWAQLDTCMEGSGTELVEFLSFGTRLKS